MSLFIESKSAISRSQAYNQFTSSIAKTHILVSEAEDWSFYQIVSDNICEPIIFLHGTSTTAEAYFLQLVALANKGYTVIAVNIPGVYYTHYQFCVGFDKFVNCLLRNLSEYKKSHLSKDSNINNIECNNFHLFGSSLGGFLALCYIKLFPARVKSLILCNSFSDTTLFSNNSSFLLRSSPYLPSFYLKKYILDNFPQHEVDIDILSALEFVIDLLNSLSRNELHSRLLLNTEPCSISRCDIVKDDNIEQSEHIELNLGPRLLQENMTIIDNIRNDIEDKDSYISLPISLSNKLYKQFPNAKYAFLKGNYGDFPYINNYEEINMLIEVHLRRNGLFPLKYEKEEKI